MKLFKAKYHWLLKHLFWWLLTIVLLTIFQHTPVFIEKVYSETLYPVIAFVNRWFSGFLPFSIGDLLYFWGFSYLIYQLIQLLIKFKKPGAQLQKISFFLLKTIWIFYLSWGLNYYRLPLAQLIHLSTENYTAEQLIAVTDTLINRANKMQFQLTENDSIPVEIPYGFENILKKAPLGYRQIAGYIGIDYKMSCIKASLFSKQISYMQVSGYLNPFSGEAQVNKFYPKIFIPSIASHEVAHQLGFAPENEANFLGYLAATHHTDKYFQYSGTIDALYYFLIEIRRYDKELYKKTLKKIHKGILKNFRAAYEFSRRYRFPVDFSSTYDTYLKINKQKSGIGSYNEMVRLVIAYELQLKSN